MKVTLKKHKLLPALQAVSRSIGSKNLPVLANVLLQANNKTLTLSATNLEIGVIRALEADCEDSGEITVPARTFLELISSLSETEIELESQAEQLQISAPHFHATLNGINSNEFPTIPLVEQMNISLDGEVLEESLPEITFAAASDEGRPVLTGILTQIKQDLLELVATDGFRLAHKTIHLNKKSGGDFRSLIPRRTFEEVVRIIGEEKAEMQDTSVGLSMTENQNQMVFKIGNSFISSRLIEGQFPSWEKIIPHNFTSHVTVLKDELLKAVKLASVFARNEANIVKLEVRKSSIVLFAEAKQLGLQQTEIENVLDGEELTVAFNARFIIDVLNATKREKIKIHFSGISSPALFVPEEEEGLEFVIMPIRLS